MQNVTMLPEVTKLMKNESCAVAMMSLAHDGHFTMNEIAVYYNLLAFSYFGANLRFLTENRLFLWGKSGPQTY